nr:PREDICTED: UPF0575 protein C19orf67 homolog isoform X2 [Latimeria chalumnae]|eukprot:XP_014343830.1 PREDICTED: UPF0575 protein C19orf67 homolog isoform X2 [Latimeria chalumnae]
MERKNKLPERSVSPSSSGPAKEQAHFVRVGTENSQQLVLDREFVSNPDPDPDPDGNPLSQPASQGKSSAAPAGAMVSGDQLPKVQLGNSFQSQGSEEAPPHYDVTLMDEKLQPIEQQLKYLLKKAEEFQMHLLYSRDRIRKEEFARAVPVFLQTCQPYFEYLESTVRSVLPGKKLLPNYIQKRLLQFSQQLASSLEQLVLMFASFGYILLEETDPCSISCFYRGQFRLGPSYHVSIFRYCIGTPYTAALEPRHLYKRMRWNVDIMEELSNGDGSEPRTELILCKQPKGDYESLLTIGFEEPSQILATDLLVELLTNQVSGQATTVYVQNSMNESASSSQGTLSVPTTTDFTTPQEVSTPFSTLKQCSPFANPVYLSSTSSKNPEVFNF